MNYLSKRSNGTDGVKNFYLAVNTSNLPPSSTLTYILPPGPIFKFRMRPLLSSNIVSLLGTQ